MNNNMNNDMNLLMNMLTSGNNPEQFVKNMISQNPQLNAVYSQAKESGMPMKDFVMQYAKQNNMNIQPFVDMLTKRGVNF